MKSRYVLLISGLSKHTRSSDIRYECERYGTVMSVERDVRERQALVEFKRSSAAADAYYYLEGHIIDNRKWRVDYAKPSDFRFFDWSWFEGDEEEDWGRRCKGGRDNREPSRSPSSERHGGGGGGGGGRGGSSARDASPVKNEDDSDRYGWK